MDSGVHQESRHSCSCILAETCVDRRVCPYHTSSLLAVSEPGGVGMVGRQDIMRPAPIGCQREAHSWLESIKPVERRLMLKISEELELELVRALG